MLTAIGNAHGLRACGSRPPILAGADARSLADTMAIAVIWATRNFAFQPGPPLSAEAFARGDADSM